MRSTRVYSAQNSRTWVSLRWSETTHEVSLMGMQAERRIINSISFSCQIMTKKIPRHGILEYRIIVNGF